MRQEITSVGTRPTVDDAINEITRVRHGASGKNVYVYGTANWFKPTSIHWMLSTPYGKLRPKPVTLVRDGITLYRDGDSTEFVIEMPEAYAVIYEIESYVLSETDLDRLKTRIDMSRPW